MRNTYIVAFAFVAQLAAGCVVVHDNPPPNNPPQGPPTYRIKPGASTIISPGQQAGFGITANFGGSYRLVWTGDSPVAYSNFKGTVYTPGRFTVFDPGCGGGCPVETNDYFTNPGAASGGGEQFSFDAVTLTGIDGIDFGVSLEPVEFTLTIDDRSYPSLVFFPNTDSGGAIVSPQEIPFALTTN